MPTAAKFSVHRFFSLAWHALVCIFSSLLALRRPFLNLLNCCLLLLILNGPAQVMASDLVVERYWLEDTTGEMSWEEVKKAPMQVFHGVFSGGFSKNPIWLRLRIHPSLEQINDGQHLYLRLRPSYLDEVVFFDPMQHPAQRPAVGDLLPVSSQTEPAISFLYELPVGFGPRDIWLRMQTKSTRLIHADVFTVADLRFKDSILNHVSTLYISILGVLFLWGLFQAFTRPEPLIVAFTCYQGSSFFMSFFFLGFAYLYISDFLPPSSIDFITNNLIITTTWAVMMFSHYILEELEEAPWRRNTILTLSAIFPLLFFSIWTGHVIEALRINMALILVIPVFYLLFAIIGKSRISSDQENSQQQGLSKLVVVVYFSLTLAFTLMTALPALGLVDGVKFSLYVVFLYSLCSGVLMVMLLNYRNWKKLRTQAHWESIALDARTRASQEKASREERERLLAMLGHEIKTPLATMRMLLMDPVMPPEIGKRFNYSVTEMTSVVERVIQSSLLDAGPIQLLLQPMNLMEMIHSVIQEFADGDRVQIDTSNKREILITTDPQLIKLILRNLLDNALKYSPPGSCVDLKADIELKKNICWVQISNKPGKADFPDPKRIFKKYYRNPKANYKTGSGLGMYLVQGLAKVLSGDLRYLPTKTQISFICSLPINPPENTNG